MRAARGERRAVPLPAGADDQARRHPPACAAAVRACSSPGAASSTRATTCAAASRRPSSPHGGEVGAAVRAHPERERARAPARPRRRAARPRLWPRRCGAASATPRAATGGQHQGIYVSRQHASNRLEHRNIRTRACAFSLFNRLAVDRSTAPLALSLLRSDYHLKTTLADCKPLLHVRLTITHPLVFTHSCSHPRSHCDSLALSRKDEADNIRTNLAGQSRATHNRSQRTLV